MVRARVISGVIGGALLLVKHLLIHAFQREQDILCVTHITHYFISRHNLIKNTCSWVKVKIDCELKNQYWKNNCRTNSDLANGSRWLGKEKLVGCVPSSSALHRRLPSALHHYWLAAGYNDSSWEGVLDLHLVYRQTRQCLMPNHPTAHSGD